MNFISTTKRLDKCDFFFQFDSNMSSPKYHAYLVGHYVKCMGLRPSNRLLSGVYAGFTFPLEFKHEKKHKPLDILDTGTATLYLISNKMKITLEENKLTGWKTFPIKLQDKKGNEITGYYGFSITGRCGPINYRNSVIFNKQHFEGGPFGKYYRGYQFDLDQWDRSDFFISKYNFGIIITERAKNALNQNKITNIKLTNIIDVELSESIVKTNENRDEDILLSN
jgi:hypothetical protein